MLARYRVLNTRNTCNKLRVRKGTNCISHLRRIHVWRAILVVSHQSIDVMYINTHIHRTSSYACRIACITRDIRNSQRQVQNVCCNTYQQHTTTGCVMKYTTQILMRTIGNTTNTCETQTIAPCIPFMRLYTPRKKVLVVSRQGTIYDDTHNTNAHMIAMCIYMA